jgi:oxygen-independent coproporphyrinogen-3 oxidase
MLGLRLRDGISDSLLDDIGRSAAVAAVQEGLLLRSADQWVLTDRGRLLADGIVARLWG